MDADDTIDDGLSAEELALEQAEAEALARALERGTAIAELPEDALEAAALLRYSAGEDELPEARLDAVLADVFENAKAPSKVADTAETRGGFSIAAWLRWLVPVGAVAAAGAWALIVTSSPEGPALATPLPAPGTALLEAQARAASQAEGGSALLASAMGDYRGAVLSSLGERYGR